MALALDFTITQSEDCGTITLTETTGDGVGGYSDSGNPAYSAVRNTLINFTLPDGVSVSLSKGYLPFADTSPNGTQDFVPSDFSYDKIPDGVWDVTLKVYTTDTASGALVDGVEYIVTGAGSSITYNGVTYTENEIFTATATATYTEDTPSEVNKLEASKSCTVLIYCGVRSCIRTLMLSRCQSGCDCGDDYHDAMNELIIDFNSAQLAFNYQNYECANKIIKRLSKMCGGICNDCGC